MDYTQYIQIAIALVFVLGLMGLLSFVLRKINYAQSGIAGQHNRIKIIEQRMIDSKNKAVIIRCDNKDHLVILSQNGTIIVENNIGTPPERSKKDIPLETI